ncbi:MAG: DUF935 domain-containing protein [Proteobacteria bacterium]|nr:DUF935 domain-containing protein [Pseudomonadota bacterium]
MDDTVKKAPIVDEIAVAEKDIDIYAGWTNRLENPDPVLRSEASGKGLKLYDEVERDGHAGAVLQQRTLAVVSRPWDVIPGEDTKQAKDIAKFVKDTLEDTNFKQACQEILLAVLYGFYVIEVMWTVKNGQYVISKFRAKHPKRFQFTPARELRLIIPDNMLEGEPLPDRKFVVFSYGSSDNPYGKGLGQKMWWPVWFKKHGIKFWMIFLDKFGSPTPVGKYPPGGGKEKEHKQKLLEAIDAIQQETGVVIPEGMSLDLLEATRGGNVTYETLCEYMDKQNTKTVLSQTGTTDIKDAGAYNASQTLDEIRQAICEADADLLCECYNESLIQWIVDYNFANVTEYPRFTIHTKPSKNSKDHAETDKILINDIGLPVSQKYLYEKYNIPEPQKGEVLVNLPEQNTPFKAFSEEIIDFSDTSQDEIDKLIDRQVKLAVPRFSKNIDTIKDYLSRASSFKSAQRAWLSSLMEWMPHGPLHCLPWASRTPGISVLKALAWTLILPRCCGGLGPLSKLPLSILNPGAFLWPILPMPISWGLWKMKSPGPWKAGSPWTLSRKTWMPSSPGTGMILWHPSISKPFSRPTCTSITRGAGIFR